MHSAHNVQAVFVTTFATKDGKHMIILCFIRLFFIILWSEVRYRVNLSRLFTRGQQPFSCVSFPSVNCDVEYNVDNQ